MMWLIRMKVRHRISSRSAAGYEMATGGRNHTQPARRGLYRWLFQKVGCSVDFTFAGRDLTPTGFGVIAQHGFSASSWTHLVYWRVVRSGDSEDGLDGEGMNSKIVPQL